MRKCTVGPTPGILVLSLLFGCGGRAGSEGDAGADEETAAHDFQEDEAPEETDFEDPVPDLVIEDLVGEDPALDPRVDDAAEDEEGDEAPTGRLFSFAIITDTHVGEGFPDYGTPGFADRGGDEYELTDLLVEAVAKTNEAVPVYGIDFVVMLGDLADSAEQSELTTGKLILDGLRVPYFPLLGNHDVWPYCTDADGNDLEASSPDGDAFFKTLFAEHFDDLAKAFTTLTLLPYPVYNPEHDCSSSFINYAFDFMGYHFICLDFVSRGHAILGSPGVMPEADLHNFYGGTWPWLTNRLESLGSTGGRNIFIFSHHAPVVRFMGIDCFTPGEYAVMEDFIVGGGYDDRIEGFFAGHWHFNLLDTTFGSLPLVVTDAAKESGAVRVVQVFSDGTVNFDILL